MSTRRRRSSLAARLFAGQLLVIVAGSLTLAMVALAIAPGLFRTHARQALTVLPPDVVGHLQRAFEDAILVALAIATIAAVVTALAASWLLAQRLTRPIRSLAETAGRIGAGSYQARVPVAANGDELAALGRAFNQMAAALESTERHRQALLADLAHELRTPLATLEAYVEGLADGVVAADQEAWTVLQAELDRLRRLTEDLTALSRAEEHQLELRPRPVDPAVLVTAAIQAAEPAFAAKGVALQAGVDRGLPKVGVDSDRLGEVLANLLANALRHTPSGGLVEVTAVGRDDEVEVAVTDNGEGIPPELLERVFERFFRVDPARIHNSGAGSGLGLTISRAIAEGHGGRMWAESTGHGRGARLVVRLPTISHRARQRPVQRAGGDGAR
ncbi:MAG TPA: ATP-binding protein [Actinomycetota bacterium]|nr:ATP-binding protein [Actinomycetota bacterium]